MDELLLLQAGTRIVPQPPTLTKAIVNDALDIRTEQRIARLGRSAAPLCSKNKFRLPVGREVGSSRLNYSGKGIEKTQLKRDQRAAMLASIEAATCQPSHGMTKEQATAMLIQDIADYDAILAGPRRHKNA